MDILHLLFRPPLVEPQSPNPQRSSAASAVRLNQFGQIWPKSEGKFVHVIHLQLLNQYCCRPSHDLSADVMNLRGLSEL